MSKLLRPELRLDDGSYLNPILVDRRKISDEQIEKLKALHAEKNRIMRWAHDEIKRVEFQMQAEWGFDLNEELHTHRFKIPYPEKVK